ncbi:Ankyrin repeat domain-containing protein 44 [Chamberlinius hualienensis]
MLLNKNPDVNVKDINGSIVLHCVAQWKDVEIIESLKKYRLRANGANNIGITPLHAAAEFNNVAVANILIKDYGADPNVKDKGGRTPLHWAAVHNAKEMIRMLIEDCKLDVNEVDNNGFSVLFWSISINNAETFKLVN